MTQFSVHPFDRISLALVVHRSVFAPVIQLAVDERRIGEVARRVRRAVDDALQDFGRALPHHVIGDDATGGAIYRRDDIGWLFLSR